MKKYFLEEQRIPARLLASVRLSPTVWVRALVSVQLVEETSAAVNNTNNHMIGTPTAGLDKPIKVDSFLAGGI